MTQYIKIALHRMIAAIAASMFLFSTSVLIALAQGSSGGGGPSSGGNSGECLPGRLCNPLQASTIQEFLLQIIEILIIFATPVIIAFIMYAGFLFVTARGNESQISDAKHALTWAVVGGVVLLAAQMIITVIQNTVTALRAP